MECHTSDILNYKEKPFLIFFKAETFELEDNTYY